MIPGNLGLAEGFSEPRVCLPGVLAVQGRGDLGESCKMLNPGVPFQLLVLVDDSEFTARTLNNFLWVTFTRSNPAADIDGVGAFTHQKHWGCEGPLVIDARIKPHHVPPLLEDPEVSKRIDLLAAPGGPLHGVF